MAEGRGGFEAARVVPQEKRQQEQNVLVAKYYANALHIIGT
jgi:hypothetical protein